MATCTCPICGHSHYAGYEEAEPEEKVPPRDYTPTVHCPDCRSYGHSHRKDCKHHGTGMVNHVLIKEVL